MKTIIEKLKKPFRVKRQSKLSAWWWGLKSWKRWTFNIILMIVVGALLAGILAALLPQKKTVKRLPSASLEQYRKQLPALEKAANKSPKDIGARTEYATALYATGQLGEAKDQYEKALEINPKNSSLYNNLGNVYRDMGDFAEAEDAYNKALSLNPQSSTTFINLANMQIYNEKSPAKGVATYKRALTVIPDNIQIKLMLAMAYEQDKQIDEAERIYNEVLQSDPGNVVATTNLNRLNSR